MRLVSLNVGRPQLRMKDGRTYSTAIDRAPAAGRLMLSRLGFAEDRVSDANVHGGPDKAVCCYPVEHYSLWRERLRAEMAVPAFGENFTTQGMLETDVCIGDTYRVGGAVVQVTQPRQPCWKLAAKHAAAMLPRWIDETHRTGFYFRVLTEGEVGAGDEIVLLERPHADLPIVRINTIRVTPATADATLLGRLADLPELSASWRKRAAQLLSPDAERPEE